MDAFDIEGGRALRGVVEVRGAKNAALPMMAAALLLEEGKLVLRRVPNLADIKTMALVLQQLGVRVERRGDEMTLRVVDERNCRAPYELVSRMRASVCVLGPLLGRRRRAEVSLPGGCAIGDRPIDLHIKGLAALGASVAVEHGYVIASARRLTGGSVYLGGPAGSTVTPDEFRAAGFASGAKAGIKILADGALRRAMGRKGRERAMAHFCASTIIPLYEAYYRKVLGD